MTPPATEYPSAIIAAGPAALAAWDDFTAGEGRRASTRSLYRGAALRFLRWLEPQGLGLTQVTPRLVERFLDEQDVTANSKVTYRTGVRRFFDALAVRSVIPSNPADRAGLSMETPEAAHVAPPLPDGETAVWDQSPYTEQTPDCSADAGIAHDYLERRREELTREIELAKERQLFHAREAERHAKTAYCLDARLDEVNRLLEPNLDEDDPAGSEPV